MIEAYIPSPKVYFKSDNAMLYEHLLKEFEYTLSACETVFRQSYMKYANYGKKWAFVVDGFGEDNFREQIYSRMCVYCAEIIDNGLIVHRGLHFSMSPLLLFYTTLALECYTSSIVTFGLNEYEESSVIKLLQRSNNNLIFKIKEKNSYRLLFQIIDELDIIDDYGEPVLNFPEGIHWGTNPFSLRFKDIQYPIYGGKYHSMTDLQEGSYCVLVARNDDPNDEYTI